MRDAHRGLGWGLILATLLAGILRLARLGEVPVSLYCDEALSAYEAWCLLLTGRDSRGVLLPLFFDIFGKGWGEPLHVYLSVPAVALLGLTPAAARLVAAVAGTLAVPATGLMTRSLILLAVRGGPPHQQRASARVAAHAGIAAAVLMAISPWSFHFSRIAFQASLLPLTLAAGFWMAARSMDDAERPARPLLLAAGAATLGLSFYTYTVSRMATPLLVAGFILCNRRSLASAPRASRIAAAILIGLALPIAGFSLTQQGRQRFSDVSLLSSAGARAPGSAEVAAAAASNYASYFSPRFLLSEGDPNPRHSIRGHGVLHPHDIVLLALGVGACLLVRHPGGLFLLWWLLTYPVAASLTVDPRHAVRAICGQPCLYALAGLGAALVWKAHRAGKNPRARRVVSAGLLALFAAASILPTVGYFRDYFLDYPVYSGPAWQYGLKETYEYLEAVSGGHDSIYITRNEDFPHVQLLFYSSFPPREYQAHGLTRTPFLFDQEVFYKGPRLPGRMNPIFVWKPYEVAPGVEVRKVIPYPDGTAAFVIAW